ncbi:MAG: M60 family metallopeptidase [Verrucomicrobiota bacterium]
MRPLLVLILSFILVGAATNPETITPGAKMPFVQPTEAERPALHEAIKSYMAQEPGTFSAHPAAKDFPGEVTAKERVNRAVSYDANLLTRWDTAAGNAPNLATGPEVWQETGLYAAPGEVIVVNATSLPSNRIVKIVVGGHRDSLFKLDKWNRFPLISRSFELKIGPNKIGNAFGGQLFIHVQNKGAKAAEKAVPGSPLQFTNAVAAPTYILGKDTPESWSKAKHEPAPWATLVGKQVILHIRTSELKKLTDPKPLLEWWDKAMALEDDLIALKRLAPERVMPDRQISAGFMHSGYPFMCWIDPSEADAINLPKLIKEGNWGFFHELGHNHQRKSWTFEGQTEVTCNLFSLYVMEKLVGKPPGQGHPAMVKLDEPLSKRLATPPNLGPFEQLSTFVVLIRAHGWGPLREALRSYATTPEKANTAIPELKNSFVLRYGHAAKANVADYFTRIGYPVTDASRTALKGYPAFNPTLPTPAK